MPAPTAAALRVQVYSALALETEKARVFLAQTRLPARSRLPIANRHITFVPERVIGQVVLLQIAADVAVGPVDQRMQLPAPVLQLQHRQTRPAFRLAAAQSGEPGAHAELVQRAPHRLDLVAPIVFVKAGDAALPGAAV